MISRASSRFWKAFEGIPPPMKDKAREAHRLWLNDPGHPSLQFKRAHDRYSIYSARIDLNWRALCTKDGDEYVWFWIGSHADYDRILSQL